MNLALVLTAILLAPGASGSGSTTPFALGPMESVDLRLQLDQPGDVWFSIRFEAVGYARDLVLDGPGSCDLDITASGGGPSATMGAVRCKGLAAGSHDFELRMELGYAQGKVVASHGRWV